MGIHCFGLKKTAMEEWIFRSTSFTTSRSFHQLGKHIDCHRWINEETWSFVDWKAEGRIEVKDMLSLKVLGRGFNPVKTNFWKEHLISSGGAHFINWNILANCNGSSAEVWVEREFSQSSHKLTIKSVRLR